MIRPNTLLLQKLCFAICLTLAASLPFTLNAQTTSNTIDFEDLSDAQIQAVYEEIARRAKQEGEANIGYTPPQLGGGINDPRAQALLDAAIQGFKDTHGDLIDQANNPSAPSAQNNFQPASGIVINASPRFPDPEELVTLTLDDYSINSIGATITWYIDDTLQNNGTNQRSVTTPAPALGKTKSVRVRLGLQNGSQVEATHTITPTRIDIIINADTVVPSFFKGSTLPSQQTPIHATAIVYTGETTNPNDFGFVWKHRNNVINGGNTRGDNSVTFTPPLRRSVSMTVEVTNLQGIMIGRKIVEVPIAEAEVLFYENNLLRGLNDRRLGPVHILTSEEITVQAHTYYVPTDALASKPLIEWSLNNSKVSQTSDNPFEITLRRQGTGTYNIGFELRNRSHILSGTKGSFRIQF